jgi:cell division septum initiation protein DivIVA
MTSKITITMILFLAFVSAFSQTVILKGQLLQDTKVIKNYSVLIDGKPETTDDAGIFSAEIGSSVKQVKIQTSDQKYIIVYPRDGKILVPKDASLITEIVVANFKSNDYLKEYLTVSKQIKDSIGKSQGQIKSLNTQLDSITSMLHKLNYSDTDLRSAKEIQEGKERNLFDITKDIEDYSRNAQNLLSAFKYLSDYAFSNSRGLEQLSEAITNYNDVYNRLDGKKVFYQKTIADYWGQDEANSFQNIISFAMDTIHANKIYPLRDLMQQIRDYFNANNKNNQLKLSIQKKIADAIAIDTDLLERLKNKITVFSQSLTT